MIERLIPVIFYFSVMFSTVRTQCNVGGYYWRDFTGDIPLDALPGGTDINGHPIFIAQVFSENLLAPAKVYINDPKAYYAYEGEELHTADNIKILCTKHPELFEWIKSNNHDIKLITNKELVIGGFQPMATTYIGRMRHGGEILVGKILADTFPVFEGLYVTSRGKVTAHTSFEVLAFCRNLPIMIKK
ncbi:hypothetical protein ILUMI_27059 [Ignelater luminosus]|uniref:Uncharacterized protein n=1 Tax=Ignelater luminosus TaxID=2038154 RepID=A0A8K0C5S0_IGNLU|nr:hypothetical protein ILUMI_27059 [Ignelater luminosus]